MPFQFDNLKVGCDPEVMLWRGKDPVSAQGLIGGSKDKPKQMKGLPKGFMILEDNVTCEFNVPPAVTQQEFADNVALAFAYVKQTAKKRGLRCTTDAAVYFPESELKSKGARQFGCDIDFNFWSMQENQAPEPPPSLRTAAGHIHLGWDNPTMEERVLFGRMFDLFLTVPSLLVTKPSPRRTLYGQAGACRFKPYGIECRAIESFWISKASWRKFVYNRIKTIASYLSVTPRTWTQDLTEYGQQIVDTINNFQIQDAKYLMDMFELTPFPTRGH